MQLEGSRPNVRHYPLVFVKRLKKTTKTHIKTSGEDQQTSGTFRRVVSYKYTDVPEVLTASIIRVISTDDGGGAHLWNVGLLLWDYTAECPISLSSSNSPMLEPNISRDIRSPGRDLKPGRPDYEAGVLSPLLGQWVVKHRHGERTGYTAWPAGNGNQPPPPQTNPYLSNWVIHHCKQPQAVLIQSTWHKRKSLRGDGSVYFHPAGTTPELVHSDLPGILWDISWHFIT
jgi:hypothetical protein